MLNVNANGVCDSPTTTTQVSRNMIQWAIPYLQTLKPSREI